MKQVKQNSFSAWWYCVSKQSLRYFLLFSLFTLLTLAQGLQISTVTATTPAPVQKLVQTGKELYQTGKFTDAIAIWRQAEKQFSQQGDGANQAVVLSNLTLAYQQLSKFTEADKAISQALNLLKNSPTNKNVLAQAYNIQGNLLLATGKAELALSSWQKAADLYRKLDDKTGLTRCLLNQTQALRTLGLYPRAKKILQEVNQNLQTQPDSLLKASSLLNFGDTLRVMGDLEKSDAVLQQSLAIAQKLNSQNDITLALLGLGNLYNSAQEAEQAFNYYQKAISSFGSSITKLQAQLNLLRLLVETENTQELDKLVSQILPQLDNLPPSRTSIYARVNFVQSLLKVKSDDLRVRDNAQILAQAAKEAKNIGDERAESYALGYLGEIYERNKQYSEAKELTEKAFVLAQTTNAADIAYRWQWQLGRILEATGNSESAIAAYTEAVKTLSYIRNDLVASNINVQFSFRESVEPVYRELVGLLLQKQGKETPQKNLKKAREIIESLQLAVLDNYFREACLTATPQQIDKIDPHAAVIYPIILNARLEVVVSLPNQPLRHYAKDITRTELETNLEEMRRSLRRTSLEEERLLIAKKTYDLLIKPIENDLQANKIKTLAFVLDGEMKNLPMAALYDGEKYLIEKYNIALTPGLQLLAPKPLANKKLKVLVGGLSKSRQGFSALPGVESEVEQIKSEIPGQLLLNQSFTSQSIQKKISDSSFPIVHLATHGQFSSRAEETFVLTWDSRLDVKDLGELLKSREQDSATPIELLVLSACQTADGDKRAALGLAGVAVRSGARSTLATLWSVEDKSTSKFMMEFYQQLDKANITKAEALRLAQLNLIKQPEFKHPFYWAPFVLVGNWL